MISSRIGSAVSTGQSSVESAGPIRSGIDLAVSCSASMADEIAPA